jgi:predicted nucleotidyltransferase
MNKESILRQVKKMLPLLASRYRVESLELFGSYARGSAGPESDIDLLVTFETMPDLLTFIELEEMLSDALGKKVDLVVKRSLRPQLKNDILKDAIAV